MNYHKEMLKRLHQLEEEQQVPSLLLHSCCAPCSTTVLNILANFFQVTILYYNPNIYPKEEYLKRKEEQIRLIKALKAKYPIQFLDCDYENEEYEKQIKGLENEKEGGKRCYKCYALRLEKTAQLAKEQHYAYFSTTLTVSPYKNSTWVNEIGKALEEKYHVSFLQSDFKKENGYLKSIEYSKQYHLYRQNYCGCIYSKKPEQQ